MGPCGLKVQTALKDLEGQSYAAAKEFRSRRASEILTRRRPRKNGFPLLSSCGVRTTIIGSSIVDRARARTSAWSATLHSCFSDVFQEGDSVRGRDPARWQVVEWPGIIATSRWQSLTARAIRLFFRFPDRAVVCYYCFLLFLGCGAAC